MANSYKKQVREPPSVPFLWEERPGIAKKDWKPEFSSSCSFPPPPVKFIASVPFEWEEKPGTPLPSFSEPTMESVPPLQPLMLLTYPSPPTSSASHQHDHDGEHEDCNGGGEESMLQLEFEAFDFETDDSFRSAPSLLANCLVPCVALSTAIPAHETRVTTLTEEKSDWPEMPSSPASDSGSSTSSNATGASSLVGASFLECLFPLIPANAGFLEITGQSDKTALAPTEAKGTYFDRESNGSAIFRRPRTLGELIMMSRRSSCRRKAVQMRKHNLSMELMKNKGFGCGIFGTGIKVIEGLYSKRKNLPTLKLM
ncbi:uncharacterized protein LOC126627457 isoform X1 [Malus sylvestris]|uniref:uncharacterized protein LOC126627457 isoform X1 n=1 Tax=Malus sylvestris TaxID=3752 RepID=UPI0021ACD374|nr:uncharacterized protein LOC126627457 isoform X1 [Malus sylvestris]